MAIVVSYKEIDRHECNKDIVAFKTCYDDGTCKIDWSLQPDMNHYLLDIKYCPHCGEELYDK